MRLMYEPEYPSRQARKIVYARLEVEVMDWVRDHSDLSPELRDLCLQIEQQIDRERANL